MATEKVKLILEAQDRMSKQIDKANKKLSMTSKIAASAKTALIGVFGIGAVMMVGRFIGGLISQYAKFEQAMRNANAILRMNKEGFEKMSRAVRDLSTELPQTSEELAKGLYDIASAGFEGQESLTLLAVSAQGAVAGVTDTATASAVLVKVLRAYSKPASEATDTMDILFKTVEKGLVTFPELASALQKPVAIAATAKVPFEEVAAAMATMTKTGLDAQLAGTALYRVMTSLLAPTPQATAAFKALGIEVGSAALRTKGLSGIMADIAEKTHGDIDALKMLFPEQRAFVGITKLMSDEGRVFAKDLEDIANKTNRLGATQAAFNEQSKGLNIQLALLGNNMRFIADSINQMLVPALTSGTSMLRVWIQQQKISFGFMTSLGGILKKNQEIEKSVNNDKIRYIKLINSEREKAFTEDKGRNAQRILNLRAASQEEISLYEKIAREKEKITKDLTDKIEEEYKKRGSENFLNLTIFAQKEIDLAFETQNKKTEVDEKAIEKRLRTIKIASQEELDAAKKLAEKKEKLLEKFEKAFMQSTSTQTEFAKWELDKQYEEYAEFVEDKKGLDEWYAAEKKKIHEQSGQDFISGVQGGYDIVKEITDHFAADIGAGLSKAFTGIEMPLASIGLTIGGVFGAVAGTVVSGFMDLFGSQKSQAEYVQEAFEKMKEKVNEKIEDIGREKTEAEKRLELLEKIKPVEGVIAGRFAERIGVSGLTEIQAQKKLLEELKVILEKQLELADNTPEEIAKKIAEMEKEKAGLRGDPARVHMERMLLQTEIDAAKKLMEELAEGEEISVLDIMKDLADTEAKLKDIPALASGGIVSRPTLALVGEKEPEAIIPLSKMDSGTGGIKVTFQTLLVDQITTQKAAKIIDREINRLKSSDRSLLYAKNARN